MTVEVHGTYDFAKVNLIVGDRKITGFENGSEITCERDEDSFTKKTDVDGGVTRARSNNVAGKITFTLSQYSASNKYMQDLLNLDERTGTGIIPAKVVDKQNPNNELVNAFKSWVMKPANRTFATESGGREWTLDCADMNFL